MQEAMMLPLTAWANFYVIIGSAAAALTGLMFVVITLIAGARRQGPSGTIAAFSTPTVVHFCAALLIALVLSAPWPALWMVGLLLGLTGLGGVIYSIIIVRRARQQDDYQLVLEDWLWHTIFPFVSYMALLIAAIMLPGNPVPASFIIGAATVLFLFIGIHNAWDNVAYLVTELLPARDER